MRFDRIYIDPGSAAMGWAGVDGVRLVDCGCLRPAPGGSIIDAMHKIPGASARIVIERPAIYPSPKQKGDPNDLIRIALMGGIAVGTARAKGGNTAQVVEVAPGAWKGQVPKELMIDRILDTLSPSELIDFRSRMEADRVAGGLVHNVLDAIGLWLWDIERL